MLTAIYCCKKVTNEGPVKRDARIRDLEERSRKLDQTEIFIETPYRNDPLFKAIAANCRPETMLSLAIDLTSATEEIRAQSIGEWRRTAPPQLHKRPTVFLLLADNPRSANRRRGTGNAH